MSALKSPPNSFSGRPISLYSLYRQRRSKAFSGIIRPRLPISPISIGTAAAKRRKVVAELNIIAITQVPRPQSRTKRAISAICCGRRQKLQRIECKKCCPVPAERKVGITTYENSTPTARLKPLSRDYRDFSCGNKEKKPKKHSKIQLVPWTRERRFLTQPQPFTPRSLSNPHSNDPLSTWDDSF